ncbi:GtrA family protein [Microbacterium bovistercoris]|uniref:GtrA family protein n=1 Tax=Microbacterium bovistercoris TaxID=2293570 RepID=A0A371NYK8_9MICO|nr:GtrA family protein [Microbacterium bovistercoris]REJ08937.1 GtrA family protein [Microbacterium bovistercoris]
MSDRRPLRFVIVGVLNTAVDFVLLFLLTALGMPVFFANIISTSVAFGFSFFANRSFTFRSGGDARVQIVKFTIVTLVSLWLLQPAVIWAVSAIIGNLFSDEVVLLIGKACATVVSMTWNYLLYARFVFPPAADHTEVME